MLPEAGIHLYVVEEIRHDMTATDLKPLMKKAKKAESFDDGFCHARIKISGQAHTTGSISDLSASHSLPLTRVAFEKR